MKIQSATHTPKRSWVYYTHMDTIPFQRWSKAEHMCSCDQWLHPQAHTQKKGTHAYQKTWTKVLPATLLKTASPQNQLNCLQIVEWINKP